MPFNKEQEERIFRVAEQLTDTCQQGPFRKDILLNNVKKRIEASGRAGLEEYLEWALIDPSERESLVSALTIHTTSWFREQPHWEKIQKFALKILEKEKNYKFSIWTAACSTGEEAFSVALLFESLKIKFPDMSYRVFGSDVDPKSIAAARMGIFPAEGLEFISHEYRGHVRIGEGPALGFIAIDKMVRDNCEFFSHNLLATSQATPSGRFDLILCRNVLIYFDPVRVLEIVDHLSQKLLPDGMLLLGHSEALARPPQFLKSLGSSSYSRIDRADGSAAKIASVSRLNRSKTVMIVDDSATIRALLRKIFTSEGYTVFECEDASAASKTLLESKFDLITLDLNMPGENGVQWLLRNRKSGLKCPVVIISESSPAEAEKVFGAIENGAQEYVVKSELHQDLDKIKELFRSLTVVRNQAAKSVDSFVSSPLPVCLKAGAEVILIGASTGGPQALSKILLQFPQPCPPVVVVQHIISEFSPAFNQRLAKVSGLKLGEIGAGKPLQWGHLYLADGDFHLKMSRTSEGLCLLPNQEGKIQGHRPSIDSLFTSAAEVSVLAIAALLTGMGRDGAEGLRALKMSQRSYTLGQDEDSCVVYGMPKAAREIGALSFVGNLEAIRSEILKNLKRSAA